VGARERGTFRKGRSVTEATTKFRGTVKCWFGSKGYGFIKRDSDGTDHFAHISEVPDQFDDLKYGQRVEFEVVESPKKPGHFMCANIDVI
jgi:CspA family cold shock protein